MKVPLLCYAIKTVANEIIHALLSHEKLNLNQLDKNGLSALHYAALYARLDLVELLLSKGCDLNQKNDDGHTPLYLAVSNGCTAVAVSLIEKGADLSETFQYKLKTPLLNYVIKSGNTAIFNALISSDKIDLRKTDIYRSTPLHIAALNGQLDMLKALLLKDVDINQKDRDGHDALYFAIYYHKYDLAIVLINKGANLNEMINFYTDELPLLAFLNTIGTRADVVCAILDKDLDLTAYSPKQLSATLTIFENDVALIPYITLLMKAGAIPSSEQLNFLLDKQMIIPLDELLENRSLHELTRRFKFDQLCNLANIQENSFEGLLLYATSVNQGLPPAAPKAQALSKALASLDPHQLCDALKLPDRKQVFWSRSDSWSHMPQKLKDFVERENVPLFPGISSKDRG